MKTTDNTNWNLDSTTWDSNTDWTMSPTSRDNEVKGVKKGFLAKKGDSVEQPFWVRGSRLRGQCKVPSKKYPRLHSVAIVQYKCLSKGSFSRKYQRVRRKRKRRLF